MAKQWWQRRSQLPQYELNQMFTNRHEDLDEVLTRLQSPVQSKQDLAALKSSWSKPSLLAQRWRDHFIANEEAYAEVLTLPNSWERDAMMGSFVGRTWLNPVDMVDAGALGGAAAELLIAEDVEEPRRKDCVKLMHKRLEWARIDAQGECWDFHVASMIMRTAVQAIGAGKTKHCCLATPCEMVMAWWRYSAEVDLEEVFLGQGFFEGTFGRWGLQHHQDFGWKCGEKACNDEKMHVLHVSFPMQTVGGCCNNGHKFQFRCVWEAVPPLRLQPRLATW